MVALTHLSHRAFLPSNVCETFYTESGEKVWEGCGTTGKGLEGPKSDDPPDVVQLEGLRDVFPAPRRAVRVLGPAVGRVVPTSDRTSNDSDNSDSDSGNSDSGNSDSGSDNSDNSDGDNSNSDSDSDNSDSDSDNATTATVTSARVSA